jgi:hypothetical protein
MSLNDFVSQLILGLHWRHFLARLQVSNAVAREILRRNVLSMEDAEHLAAVHASALADGAAAWVSRDWE